jgi:uncharacterized protein DUF3168
MTSAAWPLQQAMHAALIADAPLVALLGGPRVYDDVPTRGAYPYVTVAPVQARDFGTGSDDGEEHVVTLNVWSRGGGRKEALLIMAAVRTVLHDAALTLAGHRLVNLRHESSDARRGRDGETYEGVIRFRAVTEPIV